MTGNEIAKMYDEVVSKLANALLDINDAHDTIEYLHQETGDNGDPDFMLDDAIKELGKTLACCVSYRDEYAEDGDKKIC